MPLNLDSVGRFAPPTEHTWTADDVMLYALAVGAGQHDVGDELCFTTENSDGVRLLALPSFANMMGGGNSVGALFGDVDPSAILHAEQSFEIHNPLPVAGTARTVATVAGMYDKGTAAVVVIDMVSTDTATGLLLATHRTSVFIKGEGGFGGERGPSTVWTLPARPADIRVEASIPQDQALLYRLTGDRNPLHSDPRYAAAAGFKRPILHGMCTYGYTARLLLHAACDSRVDRFRAMSGRFSAPVLPGQKITVEGWEDGRRVLFRTLSEGAVVIDHGVLRRSL
ncbi:MaoC/PaaZ C-terminal domain-containing protein [Kitasatospora sp. NPDC059327]|uniref:MaoC/PaaZ C-terminal domain-containing protein n=1 Tax=Kitasatospora sp. NPDC059327 TaxID=3346803 RepID=UPI0036B23C12